MAQRKTKRVILRETGEEVLVNETPKQLLKELEKDEEKRDNAYIASQNEHEPYFDPNIHDLIDKDEETEDKPKRKPRVRVTAADKKAAEQAEKDAAAADSDDDDDDDED